MIKLKYPISKTINITTNIYYTDSLGEVIATRYVDHPLDLKKKKSLDREKLDILDSTVDTVRNIILKYGFTILKEYQSKKSYTYYIQFYYGTEYSKETSVLVVFRLSDHRSKLIENNYTEYEHVLIQNFTIDDEVFSYPIGLIQQVELICKNLDSKLSSGSIESAQSLKSLKVDGKLINQVGEYLRKNIKDAYKYEKKPNMYELYFIILYQWKDIPGYNREDDEVHQLNVSINLTCYQDKMRVNFIDQSGYGKVLGSWVISADKLVDVSNAKKLIYSKIIKRMEKLYGEDYDYLF